LRARLLAVLAALGLASTAAAAPRVIDPFETAAAWTAAPASGVLMKLSTESGAVGRCLRIDFDFQGGGGYAVVHRALDVDLPANYRFALKVRGATAPQNFEFKLIDASGENVWWKNRRDFSFPADWQDVATRKRQIEFAWGPRGGGEITHVAAIEFAITAGSGGKGTVWLDELSLEELTPPSATSPKIVASGPSLPGFDATRAVDGDLMTGWRPPHDGEGLTLDLGVDREFGGLEIEWDPAARWADYDVEVATTSGRPHVVRAVRGGRGARDWLDLPESEARRIRLVPAGRARGAEIREVTLQPLEFGATRNAFFRAIAKASPRGAYPRSILGEPQFWTIVGAPGGREESLFSQDGAVDLGTSRPSLEPFLWCDGRLWSWADVTSSPTLAETPAPLPSVTWQGAPVELRVTAARSRYGDRDHVAIHYRLLDRSGARHRGRLLLALRPFQVNPPSQFLNTPGGAVPLRNLAARPGGAIAIDSVALLTSLPPVDTAGFAPFDAGDVVTWLARGDIPDARAVNDPNALASGVLAWNFDLGGRDSLAVDVDVECTAERAELDPKRIPDARHASRTADGTRISLPPAQADLERTIAAQIGWIEINRDGPAIQPGSRAYARSWIRDGALTSSALLRWGRTEEVKDFLVWFAEHQYADGKVPCCVDRRGADPVPEHDSHGELIYLAAEYFRQTGDRATLASLWPHVAHAVAYLDTLRSQRLGPSWRDASQREFFGILPPSISHEGYSAKPMHSYWDDFWALRGYRDAAFLARELGHGEDARRIEATLADFRSDFAASIAAAQERHRIAYVPGCADLGDFDATSTTIALSPVQGEDVAPPGSIDSTFARYWDFFVRRRDGVEKWEAFTPYEIRNIGAFVRLGWRDRAQELVRWFMDHRSPPGWAQWAEVVWNQPKEAKFLGDLPHTWVGSDFVRSMLDCFAYERERDESLVLAAGVPSVWVREGAGVAIHDVHTWYGPLSWSLRGDARAMTMKIEGGVRVPRGGLVIEAPGVTARWRARMNGRSVAVAADGGVVVRAVPATVELSAP